MPLQSEMQLFQVAPGCQHRLIAAWLMLKNL
jgi:hypothetical protein